MKKLNTLMILALCAILLTCNFACSNKDVSGNEQNDQKEDNDQNEDRQEHLLPFTFQNPISFSYPYFDGEQERQITELRDPCIMRDGDTYYLVFTHYPFTHHTSRREDAPDMNSSPGIRLYSSKDLKEWKFENWIVKSSELPEDSPYKHRFWAPELRKMHGKYFIIFYADNWIKDEYNEMGEMGYVGFVGVADKPTGPYENITWLPGSSCDTHLFTDSDGKSYAVMPFGDMFVQGVDLVGIKNNDIKLIGQRHKIINRDNSDIGLNFSPDYMEAPWMIKKGDKYVLFSGSPYKAEQEPIDNKTGLTTGYWVGMATSDNIAGPYTKQPQIFLGGHISVFIGPDGKEWFSYRGESFDEAHGKLCIDPIPFSSDGSLKPFPPSKGEVVID
jgi:beta-xylosidase